MATVGAGTFFVLLSYTLTWVLIQPKIKALGLILQKIFLARVTLNIDLCLCTLFASRNLLRLQRNARCARVSPSARTLTPVALAVFISDQHQNRVFDKGRVVPKLRFLVTLPEDTKRRCLSL